MAAHRILHVLGTADLAGNAICQMVENLATRLDPEQFTIDASFLRCGEFVERFKARGIKAACVDWSGSPTDPAGAARFARLVFRGKYDIIHEHTGGRFLTKMARNLGGSRIVRHVHGRAIEETGELPASLKLPQRDATIANSQIVAKACGDPDATVIYPGIDVSDFPFDPAPRPEVIVGTACRLEPVKGLQHLIDAFAMLKSQNPGLRVEIAGEGSQRESLKCMAQQHELSKQITFLGWKNNLPSTLASWSIFVLPSLDEGFGVAVLEAMAAGLPVVATAVGGLPELVQDGRTGFLVPAAAPADLARRIQTLLDSPDLRKEMGRAGRRRAQENFSVAAMVKETAALYTSVLQQA
jgi:glycosyltransferase involved in cell wall biosynthesis